MHTFIDNVCMYITLLVFDRLFMLECVLECIVKYIVKLHTHVVNTKTTRASLNALCLRMNHLNTDGRNDNCMHCSAKFQTPPNAVDLL